MGGDVKRYIVPCVVGMAPALLVLLTWSPTGDWTPFELLMRQYTGPIIGAELFTIVVALREGLLTSIRRWNWPRSVLLAGFTLLVIAIGTVFFAPLPHTAILLTLYWLIHSLFALSVSFLCGVVFQPRDLTRAYLAGFAFFAVEFFIFVVQIPDWNTFDWKWGLPMFSHTRHAGYYLAAMAAMAMGVMAGSRGRKWLLAFLLASTAVGLALWTGSRGAVLALAGAWGAGLFLSPPMRSLWGWAGGLASMAVAVAVVLVAPAVRHPLMGISRTVEATAKSDVTTGRTTIWAGTVDAIKQSPVFGYGEGQMPAVAPYSTMVQPHEFFLQVTLAWGLVGLLCVIVLAFAFARQVLPAIRADDGTLTPPFMAMAALAILSLYDGALYYALPVGIFMACGAVIAASRRSVTSEAQSAVLQSALRPEGCPRLTGERLE